MVFNIDLARYPSSRMVRIGIDLSRIGYRRPLRPLDPSKQKYLVETLVRHRIDDDIDTKGI